MLPANQQTEYHKNIIYVVGLLGLLTLGFAQQAIGAIFNSNQVGYTPVAGYYLETNGATSTWATVAGASSTIVTGVEPIVVTQAGTHATTSFDTTFPLTLNALYTFNQGVTVNGNVTTTNETVSSTLQNIRTLRHPAFVTYHLSVDGSSFLIFNSVTGNSPGSGAGIDAGVQHR